MELTQSFKECSFVVYDLETTGFGDKAEIIEFAGVRFEHWVPVRKLHTLLRPEGFMNKSLQQLHGISMQELETAPSFREFAPALAHFLHDSVLVGHNIFSFDSRFLSRQCIQAFSQSPDNWSIDTFVLAKKLLQHGSYRLGELAEYFSIPLQAHHAMSDVYATSEIFFRLTEKMLDLQLGNLEDYGRFHALRKMKGSGLPVYEKEPVVSLQER